MEQKTTGTEITQIILASQMVYPPASRPVTNLEAGNTKDRATAFSWARVRFLRTDQAKKLMMLR